MLIFRATRLAPSPTGALHLGHARTFLIAWWLARQAGAKIYMRMEDIDSGRTRPESVQQAFDDLRWLGMDWDSFAETSSAPTAAKKEVVQSERQSYYDAALRRLWEAGAIYPCVCTRADIAAAVAGAASAPHGGEAHVRYPGTCRGRFQGSTMAEALEKALVAHGQACMRLNVREGPVAFEDMIAGPQAWDVARDAGDFPVTRFVVFVPGVQDRPEDDMTLPPAYQLACVVDDAAMSIDLVIRGNDLLASTPRQILVYRALGLAPPRFAHVPLIIGPDGKRLAKRHGESRIAQFRAAGVPAEKIIGWAAWRSGQLDAPREISAQEMIARFDLAKLPAESIILSQVDLAYLKP